MRYDFYAYMDRMKYIKRWQLMRSTREENIMEHSHSVALIAHALATIHNEVYHGNADVLKTVLYAMYHEISEVMTGDLPTPIKYFSNETRRDYAIIESHAVCSLLSKLPDELRDSYSELLEPTDEDEESVALVKIADKLCAYIKCLTEEAAGNKDFVSARKTLEKTLDGIRSDELTFFRENLLTAFTLTIDEM